MNERLEPTQRLILVGFMALVCIAAAIIYAVKDALTPPEECDDTDPENPCDAPIAARARGDTQPLLVVATQWNSALGAHVLVVEAFPRRFPRSERLARTL